MCIYEKFDKRRGEYICTNIMTDCEGEPCTICCLYKEKYKKGKEIKHAREKY